MFRHTYKKKKTPIQLFGTNDDDWWFYTINESDKSDAV